MSDDQYRDRLQHAVSVSEGLQAIIDRQQVELVRVRTERDVLAQRLDTLLDELTLSRLQKDRPALVPVTKLHVA